MKQLFTCLGKGIVGFFFLICLLVGGFSLLKNRPLSPQEIYRTSLGEEPAGEVKLFQAKSEPGIDDWTVYLRLQAPKATIARLVKQQELATQKAMEETYRPYRDWQTPSAKAQWFHREDNREHSNRERSFGAEIRVLAYDPATQMAQFYFHGVD